MAGKCQSENPRGDSHGLTTDKELTDRIPPHCKLIEYNRPVQVQVQRAGCRCRVKVPQLTHHHHHAAPPPPITQDHHPGHNLLYGIYYECTTCSCAVLCSGMSTHRPPYRLNDAWLASWKRRGGAPEPCSWEVE